MGLTKNIKYAKGDDDHWEKRWDERDVVAEITNSLKDVLDNVNNEVDERYGKFDIKNYYNEEDRQCDLRELKRRVADSFRSEHILNRIARALVDPNATDNILANEIIENHIKNDLKTFKERVHFLNILGSSLMNFCIECVMFYEFKRQEEEVVVESEKPKVKKIPYKHYAFLHWIYIMEGEKKQFELDENDNLPAKKVAQYGIDEYGVENGSSFHIAFRDNDFNNKEVIKSMFKDGLISNLKSISKNDPTVINYLKKYN